MYKSLARIVHLMIAFIYQGAIFYVMIAYNDVFNQITVMEDKTHPEKCSLRTLTASHMKNII
jgi:hypothetical protein